ncbi:Flp pilus assembly complex ATPase component TadA [Microbacterium sp. Sa4CUA7]|uniref:Flp pilus assembly complex ATPase component TadA n=1 Tax=Microbacterium pullorum TaxID=2762236 RepID=A0ABR8S3Q8_9MICO|nr:ATPase, T2SS/T4P/T4SS family [Microbacterium pullorum]MBD7958080.1 Flp pilus assembly complex ATPase component TadA [Microbacterium pullorum]
MRGLAESLVRSGMVRAEDMSSLVADIGDGPQLREGIVTARLATETQIAQGIAAESGYAFVDLGAVSLDADVVALVPASLCRRYQLIPLERGRRSLTIGMLDPSDLIALDDVGTATEMNVRPVVVAADALKNAFTRFLRSDEELSDLSEQIGEIAASESSSGTESLEDQVDDAPIVRFVNLLITQAISDRASDIHIEPGERQLTVRYRIDGVLHEMQKADRAIQDGVISRLKIMASIDIAERRKPQDGRLSVHHDGRQVDLRLATLPTVWGEKIVMRILDNSGQTLSMGDLKFSLINHKRFTESIGRPHGMVLVTGPTGSGKSTTLYTALNAVASPRVNVITVEDPVEYRMAGINQVQVNARAGMTFQAALRSILRSDPDVVLVGEIRDKETATISIEAALTGHLVLSTLHTNDAPSALTRLTEIGCEPFLVGTALTAVVAQRLARRLCMNCRETYTESRDVLDSVHFPHNPADPPVLYRTVGCAACSGTGYRGRVALHEVMTVSEDLEKLVVAHATGTELRAVAIKQGMVSLREDGFSKVAQGITTIEEVLRVSI